MSERYVIAITKILSAKSAQVGIGYPYVNEMFIYDWAMYATDAFLELCNIYNFEILYMSDSHPFAHAVGMYKGEKVSITLQTLYGDPGAGDNFEYAT
jgi:hypothetical protein